MSEKITANELVVISSQKSDSMIKERADCTKLEFEMKERFNNVAVSELPAIKGSRRHSAWHNMKK